MLQLLYLPASAAVVGVVCLISTVIYNVYFHPLKKYPGPFWMKASPATYSYYMFTGELIPLLKKLHDEYGDIVRFGPDELSYIDEQAWTDIFGHRTANGQGNLPKQMKTRRKELNGTPSIITANDEDHRRMRRLQSHMFSEKALSAQEPLITEYADTLVSRLQEKSSDQTTDVVDIVKWYNYTTFDILGDLAFGDSFGCLKSDVLHPWISNIFTAIKDASFYRAAHAFPWPINKLMYSYKSRSHGLSQARYQEFEFASRKARERMLQGSTDRVDFMSYILKHNDEKGLVISPPPPSHSLTQPSMSPKEIESNASLLIIAGSETTATFLSGITYNLLMNPTILAKLTTLLRTTFRNDSDMTINSIQQLEYFTACLEEGLRTYPPVPTGLPRHTLPGGSTICGEVVPGGTTVSVANWAAYQSARNFTDPEKFVPERWLKDPPARYAEDRRKVLQPFSFGPRNCIGRNLAYAEMRLILARVLWNFDLVLQEDSKRWNQQHVYALWEKLPLNVKLVPRNA